MADTARRMAVTSTGMLKEKVTSTQKSSSSTTKGSHGSQMKIYMIGNTFPLAFTHTHMEMDAFPHRRLALHNSDNPPRETKHAAGHWKLYLIIAVDDKVMNDEACKDFLRRWRTTKGTVNCIKFGIEFARETGLVWLISKNLFDDDFITSIPSSDDRQFLEELKKLRSQNNTNTGVQEHHTASGGGDIGYQDDEEDNDHLNWQIPVTLGGNHLRQQQQPSIILPEQTVIDAFYGMTQKEEERMLREKERHKPRKRIYQRGMNKQLQQQQEQMQKQLRPAEHTELLKGLGITQEEIDERNARNNNGND